METESLSNQPTSKEIHKSVDEEHTIRFALELKESNDRYFPEFSFRELLRSAVPKVGEATESNLPAVEDGEHQKLQALAKKFEEKYGPKQKHKKKRKERIEDLVDVTYGYDETDPFVDNSEAYDELIPADWTTEHGGFYINQGGLSFKPVSSDDSDDDNDFKGKKRKTPKKLKDPNKVKKIKESGEKKRKHLTPTDKEKKPYRKIRLISGDKEKKHKKKISHGSSSSAVTSSGPLLIKLITPNTTNSQAGTTKTTSATVSPTCSSVSLASSLMSLGANNLTKGLSVEGSPQSVENMNIKTENQGLLANENSIKDSSMMLPESTSNATSVSNSMALGNQNGLASTEGVGEDSSFVPKLPQYLPQSVEACVQKLKKAADNAVDEGKCKFFNKDVNQLLLETETKSRELSCRVRSGIYDYLAYYLPCTKETLLKRAKKLLLTDQAGRLREPMAKLKAAVDKAMPEQIKHFEEEVRLHVEEQSKQNEAKPDSLDQSPEDKKKELFKSAMMEVDDDREKVDEATTPTDPTAQTETEEKTKKASLPRRKFVWTDELRALLSDVVTVRVKLFEMSKTRTTSAEEYLKEFFETEVKTLWPKGWMTSRILFKESKSVHTRVTSALLKPKKVPGPKKQGEATSPSDAMDTSSQNAESDIDRTAVVSMDTAPSVHTSLSNTCAASVVGKSTPVTPLTAAVKIEQIAASTSTSAPATTSSTCIKTIPKLDPSALSILKAKLIISNPGAASKANIVLQPGNKVVAATILSTKPKTATTSALSTSAQASIVASAAKALAAMVNSGDKSSVSMVTTTKIPSSTVSSVSRAHASGLTTTSKTPLYVSLVPTKPSVTMVTSSPSTAMSVVSTSNPLTLNRTSVESKGAVTKGENTMEGRTEPKAGVPMATNVTTNGLERQRQQQAKFPPGISSSLTKPEVTSVTAQRMMLPVSTAIAQQPPTPSSLDRNQTPPVNTSIKSQPVTILDFADMVSADSQNDGQEILSNPLQPQPQPPQPPQTFISKSPSPQKPKESSIPMIPKVPQVPQTVVSPPRQQNTAYSATSPSPSSMIRSPTPMTQTRTNIPHSSATALGNMLMSCNMGSPNMANMQNKYIDLNAAAMMAQRQQQAANNKALLDSISTASRIPLDMHTTSVPLTHPVISHQLSNPTQSTSAFLSSNMQPTLSMLGHANLQGKTTNPLSHIGVVQQQSMPSSMMHINRPLQQQSNMVMTTPNPFNQDPNHNPNGGHPPTSFMPRFS